MNISSLIDEFITAAENPKKELEKHLSEGKKVVGCMPYFCPEELVFAAGMVPFGLWGAELRPTQSTRYFPAFVCSLLHTTLELGILGAYNSLTAVMIPMLCDSLKCMEANWRCSGITVPVINVAHAQNRKIPAGIEFTASQYRIIRMKLEELSGGVISDATVAEAIEVYNGRRAVMRRFLAAAGKLAPSARNAVFKSGYFMDVREHAEKTAALTNLLEDVPSDERTGPRLVTSGIIADSTGMLKILDDCGISVVTDQVTHESLRYREDVPPDADPITALARHIGLIEGCPVLYDPGKKRGEMLIRLVQNCGADGVLFIQTKFCDPEEYDYVPIKRMLDAAGIRSLLVETDRATVNYDRMRTSVETFCEMTAGGR